MICQPARLGVLAIAPTQWVKVDKEWVIAIAEEKSTGNYGSTRLINPNEPQLTSDIKGAIAELAFEKLSGLPYGFIGRDHLGRDRGDFEFDRYTVDAKGVATYSMHKGFLVKTKRINDPVSLFAFAEVRLWEGRFWGWQSKKMVKTWPKTKGIWGLNFTGWKKDLRDMEILLTRIKEWRESK